MKWQPRVRAPFGVATAAGGRARDLKLCGRAEKWKREVEAVEDGGRRRYGGTRTYAPCPSPPSSSRPPRSRSPTNPSMIFVRVIDSNFDWIPAIICSHRIDSQGAQPVRRPARCHGRGVCAVPYPECVSGTR